MNTLRQAVQEYLSMRRHLGFTLREAGKGLLDFVTFMEQHRASYITPALALAWAQQPSNVQPAYWARRLSFVRGFARHRSATDPRTQIPPPGLLPFQPKRARPYLYSDDEIERLLRAALKMPCRYERGALRPWVYYCLFGLLSVSGLRLGEARNLELEDVDLKAAMLTIRGAKFGKTRLVPLHASACQVLAKYMARRKRHWTQRPVSSYLFVSSWGHRLDSAPIRRPLSNRNTNPREQRRSFLQRLSSPCARPLLQSEELVRIGDWRLTVPTLLRMCCSALRAERLPRELVQRSGRAFNSAPRIFERFGSGSHPSSPSMHPSGSRPLRTLCVSSPWHSPCPRKSLVPDRVQKLCDIVTDVVVLPARDWDQRRAGSRSGRPRKTQPWDGSGSCLQSDLWIGYQRYTRITAPGPA